MILSFQNLILFHHLSELIFQRVEFSKPFVIDHRSVDVDRNFYLNRHFHFNFFLYLNRSVHIDGFININRFVNDHRFFVDWFINKYLLLDNLRNFDFFDDDFWNFLLDLYIFGYLNYFFYYSFRARNVFGYLYPDFNRFLHDKVSLFGYGFIIEPCFLFQNIVFHLQFVNITLKSIDYFLMLFAGNVFSTQMFQLQLHSNSFLFALCKLICKTMNFLEQFFEAFFILSIIIDINFNVFVSTGCFSDWSLNFKFLLLSFGNSNRYKRFDFLQISFSLCELLVNTHRLGLIFPLDDDGSLNHKGLAGILSFG